MTLSNLTENLATEVTAEAIAEALAAIASRTNSAGDASLISGSKRKYRREFVDTTLSAWEVSNPASQALVVNPALGNLTIASGTTANATTTLVTDEVFTAPFKMAVGVRLSQKIANYSAYIEVVAANEDGTLDENTVASWRIAGSDSTTATVARYEVANGGTTRTQSANATVQSHVGADAVFEITLESDEVWFTTKAMDSAASRLTPFMRNSVAPDPNRDYRIRLRVVNGSTAPASSTTATFYFVTAVDYTEQQVEVTGGNGSVGAAQSVPMWATGGTVNVGALPNVTVGSGQLTPQAGTTMNGSNIAKVLSVAGTNATVIKNGVNARLYGYQLANLTASWRYLRLYNKATAPVVGTDVPLMVVPIPPNSMTDIASTIPTTFAAGLSYAITGGVADLDTTAVAANDVVGHILWV